METQSLISKVLTRGYLEVCPHSRMVYTATCCGRRYVVSGSCQREICVVCGQPDRILHRKRIQRWLGVVMWMLKQVGNVGYMVITLPREYWKVDRQFLQTFRKYIRRKLKRLGIKYGKMRFHWAGDKGKVFYPHLNILMSSGFIAKKILQEIKKDIAQWLGADCEQVVLDYHYTNRKQKILHWVKYVCRPTLQLIENKDERNEVWEEVVRGFVNDIEFGRPKEIFEDGFVWNEDFICGLENELRIVSEKERKLFWLLVNRCPYCKQKLKWQPKKEILGEIKEDFGSGYKELCLCCEKL